MMHLLYWLAGTLVFLGIVDLVMHGVDRLFGDD